MKVLASPSSIGQIDSKPFDILEKNGFSVVKNPFGRKLTEDETVNLAKDCIGIVAGVENLNKEVIDRLPKLQCISRVGVGMDNVDILYAQSKNIKVVRKSIVAKTNIKKGDILSENNLTTKRPGDGISPMNWDKIIGTKAKKNYFEDEFIN